MELKELEDKIKKILKLAREVESSPAHDDPDIYQWMDKADQAIREIYVIAKEILS